VVGCVVFKVNKWYLQLLAKKRRVWVQLWGVPLHIWEDEFFKKIAASLG